LHTKRLTFAALVVITTEVQNTMNQQGDDFFIQRPLLSFGVAHGGRHRNHDITQWPCGLVHRARRTSVPCGERQHVGAAVFAPETEVETAHSAITNERQTHIGRGLPDFTEDRLRQSRETCSINRHGAEVGPEEDGH